MKNQAAKSPKNRITTYALDLMNNFLTFFGSKHSPFDQPDGALDPRLSDSESGDDARDLSAPHRQQPVVGHRQQPTT